MLSRIAALAVILLAACAATQSKPQTPWRVELATSGGIAGRGLGNVTVDSDGNVSVTTMTRKSCTAHATAQELSRIETLLAGSHAERWGSYFPENKCCDRIEYRLTYAEHAAEWIDDGPPRPEDVVKLAEALTALRTKYTCP
jgi:hypothetical protein